VSEKDAGADVLIRLARGWKGPEIDINHWKEPSTSGVEGISHHHETIGKSDRYLIGTESDTRGSGKHVVTRAEG
jgi:hypothetical protein